MTRVTDSEAYVPGRSKLDGLDDIVLSRCLYRVLDVSANDALCRAVRERITAAVCVKGCLGGVRGWDAISAG